MSDFWQKRKRMVAIVAPALFGVLYMLLCMGNLQQSIWFDESYSAYLTHFDFAKIWEFTAADVHPPLFYFLLKIWAHVFGRTDFAMRMMSVLFGALAILFTYLVIKYRYGLKAAVFASFFLSICPVFIRYGEEMRMYTLVAAIVAAASYALQLAVHNGKKRWWMLYALLMAAGMWTHYFVFLAWVAQLIYLLRIYREKFWQKKILGTYGLAILCYLPWLPSLWRQTTEVEGSGFWIGAENADSMMAYWTQNVLYMQPKEVMNWLLVLLFVASISLVFLAIRYHRELRAILEMQLIPFLLLVIISLPPLRPMFMPRYILYAMACLPLVAGVGMALESREVAAKLAALRRKGLTGKAKKHAGVQSRKAAMLYVVMGGALVLASSLGIGAVYARGNRDFYSDEKSVTKELFETVVGLDGGQNLAILSDSATLYYDLSFYASEEHQTYFIDEITDYPWGSMEPLRQSYFGKINNLDKFLQTRRAVWYVGQIDEDKTELDFPREGWRVTESVTQKLNDKDASYQILKLEKM